MSGGHNAHLLPIFKKYTSFTDLYKDNDTFKSQYTTRKWGEWGETNGINLPLNCELIEH